MPFVSFIQVPVLFKFVYEFEHFCIYLKKHCEFLDEDIEEISDTFNVMRECVSSHICTLLTYRDWEFASSHEHYILFAKNEEKTFEQVVEKINKTCIDCPYRVSGKCSLHGYVVTENTDWCDKHPKFQE